MEGGTGGKGKTKILRIDLNSSHSLSENAVKWGDHTPQT